MRLSLTKTAVDESGDRLLAREARWLRELEAIPDGARAGETRAFTDDHARFLARLGKARFRATDFELSGCGEWLQRSLKKVQVFAGPGEIATLQEAFHDCETALLYWTGPYVAAQGDFAPWPRERALPAVGDEAGARVRAAGLSRLVVAPARDRRVLAPAGEARRLDAGMNSTLVNWRK